MNALTKARNHVVLVARGVRDARAVRKTTRTRAAARELSRRMASRPAPDEAFALAQLEHAGVGLYTLQVPAEILAFLRLVGAHEPRRILEIGTAGGGTLCMLASVAADDATLISVDLDAGVGGYDASRAPLYCAAARPGQRVELVRGDSHADATRAAVGTLLGDEALDVLFIDGDHSYAGAREDFELYAPLVRPGGTIAFHDIVPGDPELVGGVPQLWQELKVGREAQELVEDWSQRAYGIGVLVA